MMNVNVFTPAPGQPSARLPVLVWIHGGGSVWALLVTEQARGLFGAAISQSGPLEIQSAETAAAHGRALAELAGVPWTRAGLAALSEDQILDLQARIGRRPHRSAAELTVRTVGGDGRRRL